MPDRAGSRVTRAAAIAAGVDEGEVRSLLNKSTIGIELEAHGADDIVAMKAAVRQAVLIWKHVVVGLPAASESLARECTAVAEELRPDEHAIKVVSAATLATVDHVLHIGPTASSEPRVVTVTNSGWLMQLFAAATSGPARAAPRIPRRGPPNGLAAAGAAALGVGELFLRTLIPDRSGACFELSLYDYEYGPLGSLDLGPAFPNALEVRGVLVGAGTVGAGFGCALSPIDLSGALAIVDHDAGWSENFGPHLLISTQTNGVPKVELLRDRLLEDHPGLEVVAKAERFRLFRYRLGRDVPLPDVVISGLDKARPRQDVQRLWAPLHIDMATKDGLQVQVLVRTNPGQGICMIKKFPIGDEGPEEEELSARTGLSAQALAAELEGISDADIRSAPKKRRAELRAARARGERRCNLITKADLGAEGDSRDDYVGSAPFSALLAGVFAASELVKSRALHLDRDGTLVMFHFVSRNLYKPPTTRCDDDCECRHVAPSHDAT